MLHQVWVDPTTRLPIRLEALPEDPSDFVAGFLQNTTTFTFDRPLGASLFQLSPPEGFTVVHGGMEVPYTEDQLPLPPKDEKVASPVVEPGTGIGPARFGMSLEKLVEVLGRPDNASYYLLNMPEEYRQVDEARRKASKEADEKGLAGQEKRFFIGDAIRSLNIARPTLKHILLSYISRGFELNVSMDEGLVGISCFAESEVMRPFTGKTSKGIGMGATVPEIENVYGPPSDKSEERELPDGHKGKGIYYKALAMRFMFRDGRLSELSIGKP